MQKRQKKIVIDYFSQWLTCAEDENFNSLFYRGFRKSRENSPQELLEVHKTLVNKFIYKKFRCRPSYSDLTRDFIKISQHCFSFALNNQLPISVFAKFQVQQYLKIFKEICDLPELLDSDIYQYWVYTSKDQFNFVLDGFDLMSIFSMNNSKKRKWRFF